MQGDLALAKMDFVKQRREYEVKLEKQEELHERKMFSLKKQHNDLGGVATCEARVNEAIVVNLQRECKRLLHINRCLKNVIRVPRLYRAFHAEMEQVIVRERAEAGEKYDTLKEVVKAGELDEIEVKTVYTALMNQFKQDYELGVLQERVLENIDVTRLSQHTTKPPF